MARQTGVLRVKGTLGGMNFYEDPVNGEIVREKPGPSREQVKYGKEFVNTRRHNLEFGRASNYGGMIRAAFAPMIRHCHDSEMHHKLTRRMHELVVMDRESEWGNRDLRRDTLPQFRHFELNGHCLSKNYFKLPLVMEASNGCLDIAVGINIAKKVGGATAWSVKSLAATINLGTGEIRRDEQKSSLFDIEEGKCAISFRHYYEEGALLFHGMCTVMYEYDAVTDENKVMKRENVNGGFVRYVG